ncbi:hypothetical protein MWN34_14500 [Ancylobacter sp. 6x-1]|uniref:DUF6603 domain-containing protein n=1 Tax=Ancylobacter crimeensis TaxID=2579147 RepID=A0ABT0DDS8_9HYPH|nr:DUF6603 domain-containing protein [Ancylobacter crimeensis]MCK0198121.1 hypothetical protein [Ancylobacter crimeensis]
MAGTLASVLRDELVEFLAPLAAVGDTASYARMLRALGHMPALATDGGLQAALAQVASAITQLQGLDPATLDTWDGAVKALAVAEQAIAGFQAAERAITDPTLAAQAESLGLEIANRLVSVYLRRRAPRLHRIAALLTLIEVLEITAPSALELAGGQVTRTPWADDTFHFERLDGLMSHPWATLGEVYFPNGMAQAADAHRSAALLFPLLVHVADVIGLRVRQDLRALDPPSPGATPPEDIDTQDHADVEGPDDVQPAPLDDPAVFLRRNLPRLILMLPGADGIGRIGFSIVASATEHEGGIAGLIFGAAGAFAWNETRGGWNLEAATTGDLPVFVVGPDGLQLLDPAAAGAGATGHIGAARARGAEPAFQLGESGGSRIEVGDLRVQFDFALSPTQQRIGFTAKAEHARLVLSGESDGFLGEVLPQGGAQVECDLALTFWSDGGLDIGVSVQGTPPSGVVPVGRSIGPLLIQSITRDFRSADTATGSGLTFGLGVNLSVKLGPVTAAIAGPGVAVDVLWSLKDPARSKNLGVLHIERPGLRAPAGVGLDIDAAGLVTGGGFLFHDEAQSLYFGDLRLSLQGRLTLKAFGLITTSAPDGAPGFSLLVFVTVEGFTPVQLGMGFKLTGVGGMLGVHRTFDEAAIRQGLAADTLAALLFPRDPAANGPAVVAALSAAFPFQRGHYLLGLLVQIGWPTPTLVTASLALVLEVGARTRLLALGRISCLLPEADNDLVRLNLDAVGVLDFDEGTVSIDAVLVDSRLAHRFPLTGSMALRARLKAGPGSSFVMAIGGLNQRFAPPEGLPDLPRITIALSSGDNPRLTCEAYFAVTANTVQFGACASLYAAAYGFSIEGDVGFDVLIQLVPIHFIADFHASVQLKHGSTNLFKLSVDGTLEGPLPLLMSGKASFEIFWCDFTIRIDQTLVAGDLPLLSAAIDVISELKRVLVAAESWATEGGQGAHGVALRKASADGLTLDPGGRLVMRQLTVPLNAGRDIDLFGGVPVAGARNFQLAGAINGDPQDLQPVMDQFSPAQFFAMSDDEKLAAPSYEMMQAGVVFGDAVTFDANEIVGGPLTYDTVTFDDEAAPPLPDRLPYALSPDRLASLAMSGAAGRAAPRRTGRARFANEGAGPAVTVLLVHWTVVPLADGEAHPVAPDRTWTELRGEVAKLNVGRAMWQLTPDYELAA